jgi:hypothetical protein
MMVLRYEQFEQLLEEFNKTLEIFTRDEPHYLRFYVEPKTKSHVFWKAIVRLRCAKVGRQTIVEHLTTVVVSCCYQISRSEQIVVDQVVLNLYQFLSVQQSLSQQIATLQKCPTANLCNSASNNRNSSSFSTAKLYVVDRSSDD